MNIHEQNVATVEMSMVRAFIGMSRLYFAYV